MNKQQKGHFLILKTNRSNTNLNIKQSPESVYESIYLIRKHCYISTCKKQLPDHKHQILTCNQIQPKPRSTIKHQRSNKIKTSIAYKNLTSRRTHKQDPMSINILTKPPKNIVTSLTSAKPVRVALPVDFSTPLRSRILWIVIR